MPSIHSGAMSSCVISIFFLSFCICCLMISLRAFHSFFALLFVVNLGDDLNDAKLCLVAELSLLWQASSWNQKILLCLFKYVFQRAVHWAVLLGFLGDCRAVKCFLSILLTCLCPFCVGALIRLLFTNWKWGGVKYYTSRRCSLLQRVP